jgi:hypothetical protein
MGWRVVRRCRWCVRTETASGRDWRDAAAYAPLFEADRSLFAWEWLRRDPSYRSAVRRALSASSTSASAPQPGDFGLVAFEPPDRAVPDARPIWRLDMHSYVLRVERTGQRSPADMFDLAPLQGLACILADREGEHLLLSDGLRSIRLDGGPSAFTGGRAGLRYALEGLVSAEAPLLTLRRFLALCRTGRFARSLHGREARARRWIEILRASDALASGADQRSIAEGLLSPSVGEPGWRSRESSIRSRAQRLVRAARHMSDGGYRRLLGPP